jgi:hypothetical protein
MIYKIQIMSKLLKKINIVLKFYIKILINHNFIEKLVYKASDTIQISVVRVILIM